MKYLRIVKKIGLLAVVAAVFVSTYALAVNAYVKHTAKDRILTMDQVREIEADCILVLGAGVRPDGSPSLMLEDRVLRGIDLYEMGVAPVLLMSGDHGRKEYDEVNVMKSYAVDRGIASEDVFMDHAGFSTYESMYRARDVFQAQKIVVVSQEYHLYRAVYIAQKMGLEVYAVSADQHQFAGQTYREIREILARNKDFLTAVFKPKPKYLGEAIPVSGNGDLTND